MDFNEVFENGLNLLWRFALTENDFGKSCSELTMAVNARKSQHHCPAQHGSPAPGRRQSA
jgi:hypothetical protein